MESVYSVVLQVDDRRLGQMPECPSQAAQVGSGPAFTQAWLTGPFGVLFLDSHCTQGDLEICFLFSILLMMFPRPYSESSTRMGSSGDADTKAGVLKARGNMVASRNWKQGEGTNEYREGVWGKGWSQRCYWERDELSLWGEVQEGFLEEVVTWAEKKAA